MFQELRSEVLKVRIASAGAELHSVRRLDDDTEYLWQADPAHWSRHAPVLFPIVGRLAGDELRHLGRTARMSQHGFARGADFDLVQRLDELIVFELRDSPATRERCPFRFRLRIAYHLQADRLRVGYEVHNPDGRDLFFSLGAHPGFACPLGGRGQFEDWRVEFQRPELAARWYLRDGLVAGSRDGFLTGRRMRLSQALFRADALVFKDLRSEWVRLASDRSPRFVRLEFPGFPCFGIWSPGTGAPFVCLEPWCGLADAEVPAGELCDKEGIIRLPARQTFRRSLGMVFG